MSWTISARTPVRTEREAQSDVPVVVLTLAAERLSFHWARFRWKEIVFKRVFLSSLTSKPVEIEDALS